MRFFPSNLIEQLWSDPTYRNKELDLIRAYVKRGDYVVDVGANVGDCALAAAGKAEDCRWVLAIEAHPKTYSHLRGNIELNGSKNVRTVNLAVGAEPGYLGFSDDRRDDMNRVGSEDLTVEVVRLDDIRY